ncbi:MULTISPECIES: hypothetical protein [unclassified Mesorhizobium]|uniref:hypothetical protein n=1 Tax=unclassified Mesorhizobium TaxID=325217 RepID=UPI00333C8E3E
MTDKTPDFPPPRWLTRAEKAEFAKLIAVRKAVSNQVTATDAMLVCDLVTARSRLIAMRALFKRAVADCGDSDFLSPQRHLLSIASGIDRTTAATQKMAVQLGV